MYIKKPADKLTLTRRIMDNNVGPCSIFWDIDLYVIANQVESEELIALCIGVQENVHGEALPCVVVISNVEGHQLQCALIVSIRCMEIFAQMVSKQNGRTCCCLHKKYLCE